MKRNIPATLPLFQQEASMLASMIREYEPEDIRKMMGVAPNLANETCLRFRHFDSPDNPRKQAVFCYNGMAYTTFGGDSLTDEQLNYAQDHLRLLSGLYGILRPLDLIQPYRLDIADPMDLPTVDTLYDFWRPRIAEAILSTADHGCLLNLMSGEYTKALDGKLLQGQKIISPIFKELRGNDWKTLPTSAKKARGAMARFIIENAIEDPEEIKAFDWNDYAYSEEFSSEIEPVFLR